uniref:Uncharacterized protein n=1 Tax=Myoviridae sp. ctx322 TaxID=2826711 RepID=A0A8S5NBS3_9CAUD|nr:MAG TPA: hypothetical protein [Myoviridae sp. ctx322]
MCRSIKSILAFLIAFFGNSVAMSLALRVVI